jgi:hypothetical protein
VHVRGAVDWPGAAVVWILQREAKGGGMVGGSWLEPCLCTAHWLKIDASEGGEEPRVMGPWALLAESGLGAGES